MGQVLTGTPFMAYVSLTSAAPGPTAFALFDVMGAAAITLATNQRLYVTNIQASTNDTVQRLVTVDSGGTTPTKWVSSYVSSTLPPVVESIPPGCLRGIFGTAPRATVSALTGGLTVELVLKGYISST